MDSIHTIFMDSVGSIVVDSVHSTVMGQCPQYRYGQYTHYFYGQCRQYCYGQCPQNCYGHCPQYPVTVHGIAMEIVIELCWTFSTVLCYRHNIVIILDLEPNLILRASLLPDKASLIFNTIKTSKYGDNVPSQTPLIFTEIKLLIS
jgi:hypothetical protein